MDINIGDHVHVSSTDAASPPFDGQVIRLHVNYDGKENGIIRVRVTGPRVGKHRVGSGVDAAAAACTRVNSR